MDRMRQMRDIKEMYESGQIDADEYQKAKENVLASLDVHRDVA